MICSLHCTFVISFIKFSHSVGTEFSMINWQSVLGTNDNSRRKNSEVVSFRTQNLAAARMRLEDPEVWPWSDTASTWRSTLVGRHWSDCVFTSFCAVSVGFWVWRTSSSAVFRPQSTYLVTVLQPSVNVRLAMQDRKLPNSLPNYTWDAAILVPKHSNDSLKRLCLHCTTSVSGTLDVI